MQTPNGSMKLGKLERRFLQRLQEHSGLAVADAWRQQSLLQPKVQHMLFSIACQLACS